MTLPAAITSRHPIFVRVTGGGSAGIATLVLDGEDVVLLLRKILRSKRQLSAAVSGDLLFGRVVNQAQEIVDEVIAAPLGKKNAGTGNEQVELSCHGGEGAVAAIEEMLVSEGFTKGRATELLERAHLNGKLSLIGLESRLRLATAVTARQAEFLLNHSQFQQAWERLGLEMAMGMRHGDDHWRVKILGEANAAIAQAQDSERLFAQHHVTIIGPANAGKSTLVNALSGTERHIVSEIPGTTLDRLDTPIDVRGLNVLLSDTAGLRSATDAIEREGQLRSRSAAQSAHLRLVVLDGSVPPQENDAVLVKESATLGPTLLVLNKSDLGINEEASGISFIAGTDSISISAKSRAGLDQLAAQMESKLLGGWNSESGAFTRRQLDLLQKTKSALEQGTEATSILPLVRRLIGTRPDPAELATVLGEEL